ncbi:DUF6323 family protein [Enterococcus sp. AZ103]|uniref:DUF6323 family protein n=1 Tax=Enterococcus sp. AZ103 TaxID=2774628 RepID=UPI003F2869DE
MGNFDITLFNQVLPVTIKKVEDELNQLTVKKGFALQAAEVENLLVERNQLFLENHLIDFGLDNVIYLAEEILREEVWGKRDFLEKLADVMEIFYYLRGNENQSISDDELIEGIGKVAAFYEGNMDRVKGYFEDHSFLEVEGESWEMN